MRQVIVLSATIIVLFAMIISLAGCGVQNSVEELMSQFQQSCNLLEFNEVLECIDPSISNKVKIAVGFIEMFTDTDTDKMFDSLASYLSNSDIGGKEFFSSIRINVKDINTDGSYAKVSATITYRINDQLYKSNVVFNCVLKNNRWYISNFVFE